MDDIKKYLDEVQIKDIQPGDTIVLNFSKYCDTETANQIFRIFNELFPENSIIWTHPDVLESIEVKKNV